MRLTHNLRKSNLKTGPVSDKEYLNIISIDDRENLKKYLDINIKPNITKSALSKLIAKKKFRMDNATKETTKEKLLKEINELKEQRDNTKALSNSPGQHVFYELDMSLTSITENVLLRSKEFMGAQLEIYEQWLKTKLPNAKIIGLVGHLDQANPHAHINLVYVGDNSLTNDLNNSFGESPHYLKMQKDFHKFVSEHILLKKYNLKLKKINEEGKKNYIPAKNYKLLQDRANKQATKAVNVYIDKLKLENKKIFSIDKNKIIEKLQIALINETTKSIELANIPKFFQNLEKENEIFEKENIELKKENEKLKENNALLYSIYNKYKTNEEIKLELEKENETKNEIEKSSVYNSKLTKNQNFGVSNSNNIDR